jgi:hypothetical protein
MHESLKQITQADIDGLLAAVMERKPTLAGVVDSYGHLPLIDYTKTFEHPPALTEEQQQFIDVATQETARLLGQPTAQKLEKRLVSNTAILTANHHGPDWLDITINGDLVFALPQIVNQSDGVIPVFAFGEVPLNNITWGMGMLVGEERIKIHPDARQQVLVAAAPALTQQDIQKAQGKISQLQSHSSLKQTASMILNKIFMDPRVLGQPDFASQATIVNHELWPFLFEESLKENLPQMVYLQMETIVNNLLADYDLLKPDSLISTIFFDVNLRNRVLANLNGQYACWDEGKITALQNAYRAGNHEEAVQLEKGSGTVFFWGVDGKGKRYPLILTQLGNDIFLKGVTKRGEEVKIDWNPANIIKAIRDKQIIPSLFTSFTAVALARNFKCYGGFMQTDYLTNIKDGLVQACQETGYLQQADQIVQVPTANYSTGMTVVVVNQDGQRRAAKTVDIIAAGGLGMEDLQRVANASVKNLNLLGLPMIYPVVYREEERDERLRKICADDIYSLLGNNLIGIETS